MRELKFRAWWKDTKRLLDGDEWYMTCSGAKHLHYAVRSYNDDDFIIEQYTGLKDKNGKEIYEGDIAKLWDREPELVVWDNLIGAYDPLSWETFDTDECEVVGNIHETPELLERKEG